MIGWRSFKTDSLPFPWYVASMLEHRVRLLEGSVPVPYLVLLLLFETSASPFAVFGMSDQGEGTCAGVPRIAYWPGTRRGSPRWLGLLSSFC